MTTLELLALAALLLVVQFAILAASIWLGTKIVRIQTAGVPRSTAVAGIWIGLNVLLLPPVLWLQTDVLPSLSHHSIAAAISLLVAVVAFVILLEAWVVKRAFRPSTKQTIGATLIALLISTLGGLAIAHGFRSLITEAFVIPTGSMAPTIYGAHADVICGNCGRGFAVSMSDRFTADGQRAFDVGTTHTICPNCGHVTDLGSDAPILGGDRIIVDKTTEPKRWEIIVYEIPQQPVDNVLRPAAPPQTTKVNYDKRLVALPGESLTIAEGDLFIGGSRLIKKPDEQLDLWFLVHDTQYLPKTFDAQTARWEADAESAWKIGKDGSWKFSSHEADVRQLDFRGAITNHLAYNAETEGRPIPRDLPLRDVRVDCSAQQFGGTGSWGIRWEFNGQETRCEFTVDGAVKLSREPTDGSPLRDALPSEATGKLAATTGHEISLAVRDGWAYVMDDGHPCVRLQFASERLDDLSKQFDPKPGQLSIFASNCDLQLQRIKISRDVYYTSDSKRQMDPLPSNRFSATLGPDEFFVLGDNSQASADSRFMGPSKMSAIIGVVRWRYWPLSRMAIFR